MRKSEFIPSALPVTYPVCEQCGSIMPLIKIEPDKPEHDRRTFECPECDNVVVEVVKFR